MTESQVTEIVRALWSIEHELKVLNKAKKQKAIRQGWEAVQLELTDKKAILRHEKEDAAISAYIQHLKGFKMRHDEIETILHRTPMPKILNWFNHGFPQDLSVVLVASQCHR